LFSGFERFRVPGSRVAAAELLHEQGIAPRYRNWLRRALMYLAESGCLRRLPGDVFEVLYDVMQLKDPSATPPDIRLHELLREETHSAQLYTQSATAASYQAYYHLCYRIAAAIAHMTPTFLPIFRISF
jgi:hypothetical protein